MERFPNFKNDTELEADLARRLPENFRESNEIQRVIYEAIN